MLEGTIGSALLAALAAAVLFALFWIVRLNAQLSAARDGQRLAEGKLEIVECIAEVGTWEIHPDTGIVDWSPHVFAIHSRDPGRGLPMLHEAIGYYHPDDRAMVVEAVRRALDEGEDFEFHARIIDESGRLRHVLSRGAARFRADKVTGVFGSFVEMLAISGSRLSASLRSVIVTATPADNSP